MKHYIYSNQTHRLLRVEEAQPKCGDHCDTCGDCLYCYPDHCYPGAGEHSWVDYEDEKEDALLDRPCRPQNVTQSDS